MRAREAWQKYVNFARHDCWIPENEYRHWLARREELYEEFLAASEAETEPEDEYNA